MRSLRAGQRPALAQRRQLDGFAIGTVLCALLVAGPLIGLPLSFIVAPGGLSRFSGLLPEAIEATAFLLVGVGAGTFLLGTVARRARVLLRVPRPALDRVGARAAARDAGLRLHALRARARPARHPLHAGGGLHLHAGAVPVRLPAGAGGFPQPVAHADRGRARARALAPPGDPARGPAARAAGDPRRRGARADGGARRLRHRQPARRAHVHGRDLPRLVQRLRPRRGHAVRHAARVGHAHAAGARAPGARSRAPRPARGARRRGAAGAPARALGRGRGGPAARARRWWWWAPRSRSSPCGRWSRSGTACSRPSSPPPRATACCSPG